MRRLGRIACWSATYLVIAWVVVRLTHLLAGACSWPDYVPGTVPVVLALAFKPMLVLAWFQGERRGVEAGSSAVASTVAATACVLLAVWSICRQLVGACCDWIVSACGRRT